MYHILEDLADTDDTVRAVFTGLRCRILRVFVFFLTVFIFICSTQ